MAPGWSATPIISTGDVVGGYQMAGIPDGLGAYDNGDGTFSLYMNHELTSQGGENLTDARVSKLVIDKATATVASGRYIIDGTEGYRRFCSATWVGPNEGMPGMFFTNEEATDGKFGGMSVAIDDKTGKVTQLPWLGKLGHENTIAVPGFAGKVVVVTTDDNAPGGVYMFVANSVADFLSGKGQLYALSLDGVKSEADLLKDKAYTGKWIPLSQTDDNKDAATLRKAMEAKGGTVFSRPEDATYDKSDPSALFFATTGRTGFKDSAGREVNAKGKIHRVKMDPTDPTRITEFRVVLDGNAGDDITNPDNLEADKAGLMIQEDLNDEFRSRPGRLLRYEFAGSRLTPILQLDQVDYSGNPIAGDKPGNWESSGVLDVSALLGPNTWLFDVQAHTLKADQFGKQDEGGQLLLLRFGTPAAPSTGSGGNLPGLPATGDGGMSGNLPLNWLILPVVLVLTTAAVALRRREAVR